MDKAAHIPSESPAALTGLAERIAALAARVRGAILRVLGGARAAEKTAPAEPTAQDVADAWHLADAYDIKGQGGVIDRLARAVATKNIKTVCKEVAALREARRVTPLLGTDALYRSLAQEYLDAAPAELAWAYEGRRDIWEDVDALEDGERYVLPTKDASGKRIDAPSVVDFALRLDRLVKMGESGRAVVDSYARKNAA